MIKMFRAMISGMIARNGLVDGLSAVDVVGGMGSGDGTVSAAATISGVALGSRGVGVGSSGAAVEMAIRIGVSVAGRKVGVSVGVKVGRGVKVWDGVKVMVGVGVAVGGRVGRGGAAVGCATERPLAGLTAGALCGRGGALPLSPKTTTYHLPYVPALKPTPISVQLPSMLL